MSEKPLIQVEQLSHYYGDNHAVNNIGFSINRGEVVGFLGANGAGKTTTMQCITGNLDPTTGQVTINGVDILEDPVAAKAMLGYLPEQPPLYKELTVHEYLNYCAQLNRIPRDEVSAAVDRAVDRCGLSSVRARLIGNLSKGYQQRVGIAQAIIHSPPVVILDEPTVGLDPIQIVEVRKLIRELGQEHSVVLSTHIMSEVKAICDRVLVINQGELILSDDIEGMEKRLQSSAFTIALKQAPAMEQLKAIPGVHDVAEVETGRFRIHYQDDSPAEAVVKTAVENNWGLYELVPDQASLEEVFIHLTRAEQQKEAAA